MDDKLLNKENTSDIDNQIMGLGKGDEFLPGADELKLSEMSPLSRRKFLALAGATVALTATACTDYRDKGEIRTYNKKPEEITYGLADYYASTLGDGSGILVKAREGRPIKIDGNPDHPINVGKVGVAGHAAIMDLYDPVRIKNPIFQTNENKTEISWDKADREIIAELNKAKTSGKEIAIVTHSILSPTTMKILDDFKTAYPTTIIYTYDHFNDSGRRSAWAKCYGTDKLPVIDWSRPGLIVSLESDFLGNEGRVQEQTRQYASRRNTEEDRHFNTLITFESSLSLTGMQADARFNINPIHQFDLVMALCAEAANYNTSYKDSADTFRGYSLRSVAALTGIHIDKLRTLSSKLLTNSGRCFIHAGNALPEETHIAVNLLNKILRNDYVYDLEKAELQLLPQDNHSFENLANNLRKGKIAVLIHLDTNPVYHFPNGRGSYGYSDSLIKDAVRYGKGGICTVAISSMENETTADCKYVLPMNHSLESWGDYNIRTGLHSLCQPVIAPLYNSRQTESMLQHWSSGGAQKYSEDAYHQFLMNRWRNEIFPASQSAGSFENFWYSCLHDGVYISNEKESISLDFKNEALAGLNNSLKASEFTILIRNNYSVGDGRGAGNGWLQELPHPVSKVIWDNYAAISPKTARKLGLEFKDYQADIIEIDSGGRKIKIPVLPQPGTAEGVIVLELGYGRKNAGIIGTDVGVNVIPLMWAKSDTPYIISKASIKKTGDKVQLVTSMENHEMDDPFVKDFHRERDIILDGTLSEFRHDKEFLSKKREEMLLEVKERSVYPLKEYPEAKWVMAIDLNKCTSCNQCVAACNVENNIAITGKDQWSRGRKMHWIRIDRYYSGTLEDPVASIQPMLCQHCDQAPCENVCPVAATTHSTDGLNQMTYNRCVGTRYCANNCPFKVRRFNFYNFREHFFDGFYTYSSMELLNNPEVTVRSRGVMEKCTFCTQRITEARQEAVKAGEEFKNSKAKKEVKTACQVACPANAIIFGDINDPESEVSKALKSEIGYKVLESMGIRPNVTYIAKLRNSGWEEMS